MNTITLESVKKGNCQFNVESAKAFRTTLSKWHDANFKIADELLQKNDRIKALRTLIDSNNNLIDKLNSGESIIGNKTVNDLRTEIDEWLEKIHSENKDMDELRKAQAARLAGAENLVTKSVYEQYIAAIESGERTSYFLTIANFLQNNGIEPCENTINALIIAVGKKSASARQICKNRKHNTTFSFQQWRKIFLGELCDMMGNTLPLYKFTYVLKDKRSK